MISPITQTQYDMGAPLAIKGFTVAILGGLGNSMAAVAAGLLLGRAGILQRQPVLPGGLQGRRLHLDPAAVLFLRPSGLFGRREACAA